MTAGHERAQEWSSSGAYGPLNFPRSPGMNAEYPYPGSHEFLHDRSDAFACNHVDNPPLPQDNNSITMDRKEMMSSPLEEPATSKRKPNSNTKARNRKQKKCSTPLNQTIQTGSICDNKMHYWTDLNQLPAPGNSM